MCGVDVLVKGQRLGGERAPSVMHLAGRSAAASAVGLVAERDKPCLCAAGGLPNSAVFDSSASAASTTLSKRRVSSENVLARSGFNKTEKRPPVMSDIYIEERLDGVCTRVHRLQEPLGDTLESGEESIAAVSVQTSTSVRTTVLSFFQQLRTFDGAQLTAYVRRRRSYVHTLLLPDGSPDDVSTNFVAFTLWNILRATFSNAVDVLGTQCLLASLGVGKGKLPFGAVANWVLKDGAGLGAKVVLGSGISARVDADPKRWRLLGDLVQTTGCVLEMCTPFFPQYFLFFAVTATLLKKGSAAALNPSYRVFLNSMALNSNIGCVTAKAETQTVFGQILGLVLGVAISSVVGMETAAAFPLYIVFALIGVLCTYMMVRGQHLRTLNWGRLELLATEFCRHGRVQSVQWTNRRERLFLVGNPRTKLERELTVGVEVRTLLTGSAPPKADEMAATLSARQSLSDLIELYSEEPYLLGRTRDGKCGIALKDQSSGVDLVSAVAEACELQRRRLECGQSFDEARRGARTWMHEHKASLRQGLDREGWLTNRVLIPTGSFHYSVERQ